MKQLKRGLAFLLVLVMVMGSMGTGVMAAPKAKTGKKAQFDYQNGQEWRVHTLLHQDDFLEIL